MNKPGAFVLLFASAYLLVCVLGYLGLATSRSNILGWFLMLTALAYGLSIPFLLREALRNVGVMQKEHQDRSFWAILPGFLVVFYGSPLEWSYFPALLPIARVHWLQITGLVLISASIALLCWARVTLKDFYSGRVQVIKGHQLVQNGPYHFVRHPAYASFVILCFGIGIGYSSLVGLLSIPLILVPGLIYRIKIEEKLLTLEFGERYSTYAQNTRRLIPFIW